MLILLYSTILIFNIYSDTPVLRNSSRQEPYISAPGVTIRPLIDNPDKSRNPYDFNCTYDSKHKNSCRSFFSRKMYSNGNNIIEVFHAPDLKMGDKSSDPKYIENIRIDFNVTIQIFIFDDKYKHFQGNEEAIFVNNPLTKAKLLQFSNNFYIHTNEYVEIKLSRTVKKVIRHGFKEYLGIPPEYEEQYILKGEYISHQQQDPAATVRLVLGSLIVHVEQEQRTYTILGSLGVIGGA
ncbi:unnamed protein product [Rhizophagus irregularis]|nr:unnamed protein product [Rhizophagus irregularis]